MTTRCRHQLSPTPARGVPIRFDVSRAASGLRSIVTGRIASVVVLAVTFWHPARWTVDGPLFGADEVHRLLVGCRPISGSGGTVGHSN